MQRSALKEDKKKKKIDDEPNANFTPSPSCVKKKWYPFLSSYLLA